jgi:MFS family permease
MVVAVAAVVIRVGKGALFSLGVFLEPIEESTGRSRTGISATAPLNWIATGIGSFVWGALSDRSGTRVVVRAGGASLGRGPVASSQVADGA